MLEKCFDNKIQPFSNNIIAILKNVSKKCSNECSNDGRKTLQINVIKMFLQKGFWLCFVWQKKLFCNVGKMF